MQRTKQEVVYCRSMRLIWLRSPMYWEALSRTKLAPNQYKCPKCKGIFKLREMQVDHVDPVINPETGWVDMPTFAARLNCRSTGLMALCQDNCHRKKTNKENKIRRAA